jgi:uncharacterized protein (TIGR00299 family) protein
MSGERVLYLEPVGGIAGDMFLAMAVDLGVSPDDITRSLQGLGVVGWKLSVSRSARHHISGTHVDVEVDASAARHEHRSLQDIQKLIRAAASLPARAQERALAVFQCLGEAEARVHGVPVAEIHFHEVGAVDSIVDICGAAAVLELLGDPVVYAAPPPLGSGLAKTAHGTIPVPGPATLEILRDLPVRFEGVGELTTPTGAALLKTLCRVGAPPEMTLERIGYGVGTADFPDRANVLRGSVGRLAHAGGRGTFVVEANLDDCSPQWLGHLVERLLELGALDAYVLPATMKKSRPGHLLGAVVPADAQERVVAALLQESTSLGVRFHRVERIALERDWVEVDTPFGRVRVKVGRLSGVELNAQPEYEDCVARGREHDVPAKRVWAEALAAYTRASKGPARP